MNSIQVLVPPPTIVTVVDNVAAVETPLSQNSIEVLSPPPTLVSSVDEVVTVETADPTCFVTTLVAQGPQGPSGPGEQPLHNFSYGDATPSLIATLPAGSRVLTVIVYLDVPINGVGASISVGTLSNPNGLASSTQIGLLDVASYEFSPQVVYEVETSIFLFISPGSGTTAGSGSVLVSSLLTV